jgi:ubiquinone/menaquinone biosynthesis C-methylase UbiE
MTSRSIETTPIFKPVAAKINTLECITGEVLWHSLTNDPAILKESDLHYDNLVPILDSFSAKNPDRSGPLRVLELAAYSHVTGYKIAEEYGASVVLADISSDTLRRGLEYANERYSPEAIKNVQRWAIDFHELPFDNDSFDIVYISSALHHTWEWEQVISEMCRVTDNNGYVYLYNEPCMREFCFYKFRSNRAHDLSDFEVEINRLGLLMTIAEPYLGTRAEALFGMVEN